MSAPIDELIARDGTFKPVVLDAQFGDTEMIMVDCTMVWERWDARTEIALDANGLLVGVRLNGFVAQQALKASIK